MSNTVTPNWTDNVSVIASGTLAKQGVTRGTLDARTKFGARFFIRIGRGGTTALSNGVVAIIRSMINAAGIRHPGGQIQLQTVTTAAASTTCAGSGNNAGVTSLAVASTTGIVANDFIFIHDTGTADEWARVSYPIDSTHLQLDAPTINAHNNTGATVRNQAFIPAPIELPGGCEYEVIIDYGNNSAGDDITLEVLAQTFDSDTVV